MRLYNQNIDKIADYKTIPTVDGNLYVDKLTEQQLNSYGYFPLDIKPQPNRRYYTYTEQKGVVNGKYVIDFIKAERPITEVQEAMLKDLKEAFIEYSTRPKVDTGLGYIIDGGRADLNNFEIGREFAFPIIKDADGIEHTATDADYATAILAIKQKGISLYQQKWYKEAEIKSFTTVQACILYEATPYDVMVDVIDELTGEPTGTQELRTFHKNKVKDW